MHLQKNTKRNVPLTDSGGKHTSLFLLRGKIKENAPWLEDGAGGGNGVGKDWEYQSFVPMKHNISYSAKNSSHQWERTVTMVSFLIARYLLGQVKASSVSSHKRD